MNKAELLESIQDLKDRQEELSQIQLSNPEEFTDTLKKEFDSNAKDIKTLENRLAIVEEALKQNASAVQTASQNASSAQAVVIKASYGLRYSPRTGKEVNKPKLMSFSIGEWQVFKTNHKLLGYTVTEVINDPFGDAAALVEEPKD